MPCFAPVTFVPVDGQRIAIERSSLCVVQVGGCSGVLVGDRIILTAKHCTLPDELTVRIEGSDQVMRKVFTSPEVDGPVAFVVATESRLPALPLAAGPPDAASENPFQQ
ncbi:MAG: trypsin-like serine protease [Planctomycetaceae bacterium]|nr:trypsin-like serine protease [Planctomycetaceae bacterium]